MNAHVGAMHWSRTPGGARGRERERGGGKTASEASADRGRVGGRGGKGAAVAAAASKANERTDERTRM